MKEAFKEFSNYSFFSTSLLMIHERSTESLKVKLVDFDWVEEKVAKSKYEVDFAL